MTPIFCCGFECGQIGNAGQHWQAATGVSIQTTTKRNGDRAMRCNPSAAAAASRCGINAVSAGTVLRFYIRFTTLPSADTMFAWITDGTGTVGVGFKQSDSKIYSAHAASGVISFGSSGVTVATGVWYRIDASLSPTNGTSSVRVDGTVCNLGSRTGFTATLMNFGNFAAASGDWFFDDVVISTTTADYPIGVGKVEHFVPTADGTHNTGTAGTFITGAAGANITNSTTTAYQLIDEVPLDDTTPDTNDYINQAGTGATNYTEHIFGPAPGISTPTTAPRAVEVIAAHHQAGTGAGVSRVAINDNGTEDTIVSLSAAGVTTIRYARQCYSDPPSAASAWTIAGDGSDGDFLDLRVRFGYSSDANPDQFFDGVMIEAEFVESSGSNFSQNVSGGITPAGAIKRDASLQKAGSITPSASAVKAVNRSLTGNTTPSGVGRFGRFLSAAGGLTPSGAVALLKLTLRALAGVIVPTSAIKRDLAKPMSGSVTPSANVTKNVARRLLGSIVPAASAVRLFMRSTAGSLVPAATIKNVIAKIFTGSLTPSATVRKDISRRLTASITPTAAIQALKAFFLSLTGTQTPSGTVKKAAAKTLTGSETPAATIAKTTARQLTGSITPTSAIVTLKAFFKSLTGVIVPSGTIVRSASKPAAGNVTPSAVIRKDTSKKLLGSITPSGTVQTLKAFFKALVGTIVPSGSVVKTTTKRPSGTISPQGSIGRSLTKILTASIAPSAVIQTVRISLLSLAGSISPIGAIKRTVSKSLTGIVSIAGDISTFFSGLFASKGQLKVYDYAATRLLVTDDDYITVADLAATHLTVRDSAI